MASHEDAVGCVRPDAAADPVGGTVRWDPYASFWNGGSAIMVILFGPATISPGAFALFIFSTGMALLLGHSIGMHRLLIHRSFTCPRPLEYMLVWCGIMVGMNGPLGMMRTHDLRDWAQRQPACHDYLSHRRSMGLDALWQLHCRLELRHPPRFDYGSAGADPVYLWLDRTWRLHHLVVAMLLYTARGWSFVVWGVCARIAIAAHGHWLIGHLAHRYGAQSWLVDGAGVQAHDVPWAAIPTMGEAWHNNHHAFPGSARIGLFPGQSDWGYAVIRLFARMGLVWDIRLPPDLVDRHALLRAGPAWPSPLQREAKSL